MLIRFWVKVNPSKPKEVEMSELPAIVGETIRLGGT